MGLPMHQGGKRWEALGRNTEETCAVSHLSYDTMSWYSNTIHRESIDGLIRILRPMAMLAIERPLPAEIEEMVAEYIEDFGGYFSLHHEVGLGRGPSAFIEYRKAGDLYYRGTMVEPFEIEDIDFK